MKEDRLERHVQSGVLPTYDDLAWMGEMPTWVIFFLTLERRRAHRDPKRTVYSEFAFADRVCLGLWDNERFMFAVRKLRRVDALSQDEWDELRLVADVEIRRMCRTLGV